MYKSRGHPANCVCYLLPHTPFTIWNRLETTLTGPIYSDIIRKNRWKLLQWRVTHKNVLISKILPKWWLMSLNQVSWFDPLKQFPYSVIFDSKFKVIFTLEWTARALLPMLLVLGPEWNLVSSWGTKGDHIFKLAGWLWVMENRGGSSKNAAISLFHPSTQTGLTRFLSHFFATHFEGLVNMETIWHIFIPQWQLDMFNDTMIYKNTNNCLHIYDIFDIMGEMAYSHAEKLTNLGVGG